MWLCLGFKPAFHILICSHWRHILICISYTFSLRWYSSFWKLFCLKIHFLKYLRFKWMLWEALGWAAWKWRSHSKLSSKIGLAEFWVMLLPSAFPGGAIPFPWHRGWSQWHLSTQGCQLCSGEPMCCYLSKGNHALFASGPGHDMLHFLLWNRENYPQLLPTTVYAFCGLW